MRTIRRKILRWKQLQERGHPYSRTQTWRKARNPTDPFPAPMSFGANRIGWFEDEYEEWLESRPRVRWAADAAPEPEAA